MKRIIGCIGLVMVSALCMAQNGNYKFATVVGAKSATFKEIEVANASAETVSERVNFGNQGGHGRILVIGNKPTELGKIQLINDGTSLTSSSVRKLLLANLTMFPGGTVQGKAIYANVGSGSDVNLPINLDNILSAEDFLAQNMIVDGGKTSNLYLGDCDETNPTDCSAFEYVSSGNANSRSIWTNEYPSAYVYNEGTKKWEKEAGTDYQKQFLLRQGIGLMSVNDLGRYNGLFATDDAIRADLDHEFTATGVCM